MREIWDVYNSTSEHTGKKVARGEYTFKDDEYHLIVNTWLYNSEGQLLVQRRALDKDFYPGVYAAHGGCVLSGETSVEGSIRETFEEIGILIKEDELTHFVKGVTDNGIFDSYICYKDVSIDEVVIDEEEVHSCKYMSIKEVIERSLDGSFFNYLEHYGMSYFESIEDHMTKHLKGYRRLL